MLSSNTAKNQRKYSYGLTKNKAQSQVPRSLILPSSQQLYKVIKDLQNAIKQQKQKNAQLQQQLNYYKRRNVERQTQFLEIIEKYQKHQQVITQQNPQIDLLYNKILGYFDQFNNQTSQVIQQKYHQSMQTMDRRIRHILLVVEEEIKKIILKVKKMPTTVFDEIKKLEETSKFIENKNYQVMEVIDKIKYQNQVLKSERNLILKDVIKNKAKDNQSSGQNFLLKMQIKALRQQNKRLKQEKQYRQYINQPTSSKKIIDKMQKMNSESKITQKKLFVNRYDRANIVTQQDKASIRSSFQFKNIDQILQQKNEKKRAQISCLTPKKNIIRTPRNFKNQTPTTCPTNRFSSQFTFEFPTTKNELKNASNQTTVHNKNNFIEAPLFSSQIIIPAPNITSKQAKQKQYNYINTIQNLQKTLKREKTKSNSLGGIITKLNNKYKQVNVFIEEIMKQFENEDEYKDKIFNKNISQKIVQKLKGIRQNLNSPKTQQQNNPISFDL